MIIELISNLDRTYLILRFGYPTESSPEYKLFYLKTTHVTEGISRLNEF